MTRAEVMRRYPIDTRVVATKLYRRAFPSCPTEGVIYGYSRGEPPLIRVLRGRQNTPVSYHPDFWRVP